MSNYIVDGADLTSVANAIRTKGGTSAQLQFPGDFVSAIAAISGGGESGDGNKYASGEVVIASDIASPVNGGSRVFPGIRLDFVPDFIWISMTNASFNAIKANATTNHIYMLVCARKSVLPSMRINGSVPATDESRYDSFDLRAIVWATGYNEKNGHPGVAPAGNIVDSSALGTWKFNADGTFSYGRHTSASAAEALYAGTYRYIAIKFAGGAE